VGRERLALKAIQSIVLIENCQEEVLSYLNAAGLDGDSLMKTTCRRWHFSEWSLFASSFRVSLSRWRCGTRLLYRQCNCSCWTGIFGAL